MAKCRCGAHDLGTVVKRFREKGWGGLTDDDLVHTDVGCAPLSFVKAEVAAREEREAQRRAGYWTSPEGRQAVRDADAGGLPAISLLDALEATESVLKLREHDLAMAKVDRLAAESRAEKAEKALEEARKRYGEDEHLAQRDALEKRLAAVTEDRVYAQTLAEAVAAERDEARAGLEKMHTLNRNQAEIITRLTGERDEARAKLADLEKKAPEIIPAAAEQYAGELRDLRERNERQAKMLNGVRDALDSPSVIGVVSAARELRQRMRDAEKPRWDGLKKALEMKDRAEVDLGSERAKVGRLEARICDLRKKLAHAEKMGHACKDALRRLGTLVPELDRKMCQLDYPAHYRYPVECGKCSKPDPQPEHLSEKDLRCDAVYDGPSYPKHRGVRCEKDAHHVSEKWDARHMAHIPLDNVYPMTPISWYDAEQKKERKG